MISRLLCLLFGHTPTRMPKDQHPIGFILNSSGAEYHMTVCQRCLDICWERP